MTITQQEAVVDILSAALYDNYSAGGSGRHTLRVDLGSGSLE